MSRHELDPLKARLCAGSPVHGTTLAHAATCFAALHHAETMMPSTPIALLAAVLTAAAAVGAAHAQETPVLPSHICQTPSRDEFAGNDPRSPDATAAARRADERWTAAYQAVIARCQKGDLLVLTTRDAQANSLRFCDFDRPVVHGSPTGETVCVFAGGRREPR